MNPVTQGTILLVVAALMNANFATPMKFTRKWAWENTWLAWTVFALLVLPPITTALTVPHLGAIYRDSAAGIVLNVALFGAGWGIAQVFFGLAVDSIGVALTFSIVMGISAAVGSMIPLVRLHPERIHTAEGHALMGGVALMLCGVVLCALAGRMRERALKLLQTTEHTSHSAGLVLAILCGLGASFVNLGLAFGAPLVKAAQAHGATSLFASNAVWLPLMTAGAIPNLLYCLYLLRRNRTYSKFSVATASHGSLAFIMAVLWFTSSLLYGLATIQLGNWGPILGWPLFMSLIVITATITGFLTGEWKGSGARPVALQWSGVALLIVAVFVLTHASQNFN
jgi:L-rhamnose-H+ transport protein